MQNFNNLVYVQWWKWMNLKVKSCWSWISAEEFALFSLQLSLHHVFIFFLLLRSAEPGVCPLSRNTVISLHPPLQPVRFLSSCSMLSGEQKQHVRTGCICERVSRLHWLRSWLLCQGRRKMVEINLFKCWSELHPMAALATLLKGVTEVAQLMQQKM